MEFGDWSQDSAQDEISWRLVIGYQDSSLDKISWWLVIGSWDSTLGELVIYDCLSKLNINDRPLVLDNLQFIWNDLIGLMRRSSKKGVKVRQDVWSRSAPLIRVWRSGHEQRSSIVDWVMKQMLMKINDWNKTVRRFPEQWQWKNKGWIQWRDEVQSCCRQMQSMK